MKSPLYKLTLLFSFVLVLAVSCKKEYQSIEEIDTIQINNFLTSNKLTGFRDTLGIYYKVTKPGTGEIIDYKKETPILFTVRSLDGRFTAVDTFASYNRFANRFGYVTLPGISGYDSFREVIKNSLVKRNGEVRLLIPSRLAYGKNSSSFFEGYSQLSLPGNSSLDVTVKVIGDLSVYEDAMIRKYISDNNLGTFTRTNSGLYYKVSEPGTGSSITADSTVTVTYTGKLLNGTVFDSATEDDKASFDLSEANLSAGWKEGVPKIKEGGTIRLIMPSSLAYGLAGATNQRTGLKDIPPFSPLDFDIKVTDVPK